MLVRFDADPAYDTVDVHCSPHNHCFSLQFSVPYIPRFPRARPMARALCRVGSESTSGYIGDVLAPSLCFCCIMNALYIVCLEMSPRLQHLELQLFGKPELHATVPRMRLTLELSLIVSTTRCLGLNAHSRCCVTDGAQKTMCSPSSVCSIDTDCGDICCNVQ
jgi:hypothetical protein